MTIDEAIAHAREVAEKNRNFDVIPEKVMDTSTFKYNCLKCAEEHEQLAEWLEELKKYREIGLTQYMIKGLIKSEMQAHKDTVHNAELLDEYEEIWTIEECMADVEKQKVDKELESHDEKHILKSCLGLMQDMVDEFAEWYRWQHGEDSIEKLDEEERFCIRKTYFRIVKELFLLHTNHSGGTSTRAKCKQLGVDWGEEIEFDWSDEE